MTSELGAVTFAGALAIALVSACSPANVGGPDAGDAGTGPSTAKACADESFARCSRLQACSPIAVQLRFGNVATCQAAYKQNCENTLAAPSTGSTAVGREACAQALPGWDCTDYLNNANPPPECVGAPGGIANGGICGISPQCQSDFCALAPGSACGTCAPQPKASDSCAELVSCGASNGLACQLGTNLCTGYASQGGSCTASQPCAAGLNCIGYTATASGTCEVAATSVGAPCPSTSAGCSFFAGVTCNTGSLTCGSVQFAAPGQPCGSIGKQGVTCSTGTRCIGANGTTLGTCQQLAAIGGACDLVNGPVCPTIAHCIATTDGGTSGTCQYPSAALCK